MTTFVMVLLQLSVAAAHAAALLRQACRTPVGTCTLTRVRR